MKSIEWYSIHNIKQDLDYLHEKWYNTIPMFIGQPCIQSFWSAIREYTFERENLCYGHTWGNKILRKKIASQYNIAIDYKNISMHYGASDALQKILFILYNNVLKQKNILVHTPMYSYYKWITHSLWIEIVERDFRSSNLDELEELIVNKKIGCVLFSHPNNPTWYIYTKSELNKQFKIYKSNNMYIISDEVYRWLNYTHDRFYYSSIEAFSNYSKLIIVDSFSKRYNICWARIGYSITSWKINHYLNILYNNEISNNWISENLALRCLNGNLNYTTYINTKYKKIVNSIYCIKDKFQWRYIEYPHSWLYFFIKTDLPDTNKFAYWLLHEGVWSYWKNVVWVCPWNEFYLSDIWSNYLRVSFCLNKSVILHGIHALYEWYKQFKNTLPT